MNLDAATALIYKTFATAWGASTPLTRANEPFTEPAGAAWVRLSVEELGSRQKTLAPAGSRKWERKGLARVELRVPAQGEQPLGGTQALAGYVDTARLVFEGVRLDAELFFSEVNAVTYGVLRGDPAWYLVNVEALFTYYQTH